MSVLNRTVQVNPNGTWVIPNVPTNIGQVRARATCVKNGVTTSRQSNFFNVPHNGVVGPISIIMGVPVSVPASLIVTTPTEVLNAVGASVQLTVTSTLSNGVQSAVTPSSTGTNYASSNSAVATVSPDGLVTAVASGTAIINAMRWE